MEGQVRLFDHIIGELYPSFIIGEIGLNHNGDLGLAKKLIFIASDAKCNAVKFQKRYVDGLAIKSVLDAPDNRFPKFGRTYREIREFLEFDESQYKELMHYAKKCGISFICTAFDIESVNFLERLDIGAYKIASHSLTNIPLLNYIAKIKKPVILSTGMCELEELDRAVSIFREKKCPLILMHCVSAYPQPIEDSNLKLIQVYRERYSVPIGYSGHEIGYLPTLGAIFFGAKVIERHITLDKTMEGFDHKLSLDPEDLSSMVKEIRMIESAIGRGKKYVSDTEMITRRKYHVSIVSKIDIKPGAKIEESMICYKNPGTGIPAYKKNEVVDKIAKVHIEKNSLIQFDMLE